MKVTVLHDAQGNIIASGQHLTAQSATGKAFQSAQAHMLPGDGQHITELELPDDAADDALSKLHGRNIRDFTVTAA